MEEEIMEIKLVHTPDTPIVSVREHIAIENFGALIGKAFALLQKTGATCVGSPITIYHSPQIHLEGTDLEVGFPVRPADNFTRILKGCLCASGLHKGAYSRLPQTYKQICEWVRQNGYAISGAFFEIYLNDPRELPPQELITGICIPIRK